MEFKERILVPQQDRTRSDRKNPIGRAFVIQTYKKWKYIMDHIVYLDTKADELGNLLSGKKTMIIRGAAGRKLPYGRVGVGDILYFINNNAEGEVKAKAAVSSVTNSEKMNENESTTLIKKNQNKLQLTDLQLKRWSGKRYIILIEVNKVEIIKSFPIDKSNYGNMDDWLPVESINSVRI
jgi:hypothetical protein